MFRETISQTALTTDTADMFFDGKIYGDRYRDDVSFVTTLRALLANRLPEGDSVYFKYQRSSRSADRYRSGSDSGYDIKLATGFDDVDEIPGEAIIYHRLDSIYPDDNNAGLEYFEKYFTKAFPGYERIQRMTDFFVKRAKVLCFANPEQKTVFLITGAINLRIYHYIQCGVYAMLPWYFAKDERPGELEMEVILSLRESEPNRYKQAIKKFAESLNFRELAIRRLLTGFESATFKQALTSIAASIEASNNRIADLYRNAREERKRKSEMEIKSLGLMAKIADTSQSSEYMEYFLSNKNLKLVSCSGTTVCIVARGYLSFYDEDAAENVINNSSGVLYRPDDYYHDDRIPRADMKQLMTAVFLDKKIKIRMCAYYYLSGSGVDTQRGYDYGSDFDDCTPNPHIDRYACIGNYVEAIDTLLGEGDYIGATEQCMASCQSLNFGDYPVMQEFALRIYGLKIANMNCFELPDGTVTNPKGAIEWLKNEETRQAETQEG